MKKKELFYFLFFPSLITSIICGCTTNPALSTEAIPPVSNVNLEEYLGIWYEIARLPNWFEQGLFNVTATYSLLDNGDIRVLNEGNKESEPDIRQKAEGRAWIPDKNMPGLLKVSFFLWFASDYKIIKLDAKDYRYAVVTSNTKEFLWILSRTPKMDDSLYQEILDFCRKNGFRLEELIKVKQVWE
jgi:apolipoprotein D and lipocalin family protein